MNKIFEYDGDIYVRFDDYRYGIGITPTVRVIPKDKMNFVEKHIGPKGGFHGWEVMSTEENETPLSFNGHSQKFKVLQMFGGGQYELFEEFIRSTHCRVEEITFT